MKNFLFIVLQYLLPQKLLSRIAGYIAENKTPWFKNFLIETFIKKYGIDMSIAENPNINSYLCFNDFFTRPLVEGVRPIAKGKNVICCPADGAISQIGKINHQAVFQAKGHQFQLLELLGGQTALAKAFTDGHFATIYLSPKDYHRVHMPFAGTLRSMIHVPGDLFSVNTTTAENVPKLFARNERVIAVFDTNIGPMIVILVGAMIVASIETVWAGLITPYKQQIRTTHYKKTRIALKKGEEMGRFKLGSTAIILFPKNVVNWAEALRSDSNVVMGQAIGNHVEQEG